MNLNQILYASDLLMAMVQTSAYFSVLITKAVPEPNWLPGGVWLVRSHGFIHDAQLRGFLVVLVNPDRMREAGSRSTTGLSSLFRMFSTRQRAASSMLAFSWGNVKENNYKAISCGGLAKDGTALVGPPVKYVNNIWMGCCGVLYWHSWFPQNKPYWLFI